MKTSKLRRRRHWTRNVQVINTARALLATRVLIQSRKSDWIPPPVALLNVYIEVSSDKLPGANDGHDPIARPGQLDDNQY
jgi:hypothetical protein